MSTPLNHPTNYHQLRRNLLALARDHREGADQCRPDDPALDGHLTALLQIEAALERLNGGSYGLCGRCACSLEPERLDALPAVALCSACECKLRPFVL